MFTQTTKHFHCLFVCTIFEPHHYQRREKEKPVLISKFHLKYSQICSLYLISLFLYRSLFTISNSIFFLSVNTRFYLVLTPKTSLWIQVFLICDLLFNFTLIFRSPLLSWVVSDFDSTFSDKLTIFSFFNSLYFKREKERILLGFLLRFYFSFFVD